MVEGKSRMKSPMFINSKDGPLFGPLPGSSLFGWGLKYGPLLTDGIEWV